MRAAFYECDVTPPLGGFMWGHYHDVRAKTVRDRLYAKALVVEDAGEVAAIIVVDTCALPPEMHEIVTKRIQEYTGIAPERVCITSNHSHSGAPVSSDATSESTADMPYKDVFFRLCADAVTLAYNNLEEVDMKFAETEAHGISFNRNSVLEDGTYVTWGRGRKNVVRELDGIDPAVPFVMFEKDGKPIGAIINFACHQCCLGKYDGYSGDYSSILSKRLKAEYGSDFVSLFLLGTCGDINHINPDPNIPIPSNFYEIMGNVLADAVLEAVKDAKPVEGGLKMISKNVEIARRIPEKELVRQLLLKWQNQEDGFMRSRNLIHYEATYNNVTSDELIVQGIKLGDVLISTLPGEVYNAIGKAIKSGSPFERNIVVENCNKYCGYIPNREVFGEHDDLYETSLCRHSCHVPEAGDILRDEAVAIAKELAK